MKIGCVILAGGNSSRMREDKALLKVHGKSFIEHIAEVLDFFDEKYISRADKTKINLSNWEELADVYEHHGPIGGLHASLSKCKSDALFVISCDCPNITSTIVRRLCAHLEEEYDAIIAKDEKDRIHPLCGVYRKQCKNIFEKQILEDNNRLMLALDQMKVKYILVESKYLINVNTPQEYKKLKK